MHKAATAPPDPRARVEDCPDWYILLACARWQASRARLLLICADGDNDTLFGHLPDKPGSHEHDRKEHHARMDESLGILEGQEPETTAGAQRMVEVVMTILGDREINPEYTIARGNLRLILRNVARALEHAPDVKLRPSLPPETDAD